MSAPKAKNIALWMICVSIFLIMAFCSKAHALTTSEREIVSQMKDTITELRSTLSDSQKANDEALKSLSMATIQAADLTAAAVMAQSQAAQMTAERDKLKDDAVVMSAKLAKLNGQYQFAQFIIAAVSALAAALLAFQFTRAVPPPYNLVIPLGVAGVVYGLVTILI